MSDTLIEPRLLKGFRDTLPSRLLARKHMFAKVEDVLQRFGFLPLETPVLEYADILMGKLGDEGEKLMYRFRDHGDREVAMRYDLTVPLARVVAQYPDLPKPFKRYQASPVWRADNTQRGRYREFYQFDMDIVGTTSILADAEILVLMQEILQTLGVKDFKIRVNNRQFMDEKLKQANLSPAQHQSVYTWFDKWDKIGGHDAVMAGLSRDGLTDSQIALIKTLLLSDDARQHNPITTTLETAQKLGLSATTAIYDPTIVRGLDYYSGIVFETTLTHAPDFGSVFAGGRYDGLVGRFAKQQMPAVGTSLGVDRLMAALDELGLLPDWPTTTNVFATLFNDETVPTMLTLVNDLRNSGLNVEMAYEPGSLGRQLKQAASKGIPYAIIMGPEELAHRHVTLRNLNNGEEEKLSRELLVSRLLTLGH